MSKPLPETSFGQDTILRHLRDRDGLIVGLYPQRDIDALRELGLIKLDRHQAEYVLTALGKRAAEAA